MPAQSQIRFTVVHSIPGRIRLRLSDEGARLLSKLLEARPEVSAMHWSPDARSLTVLFDRSLSFEDVVARLPGVNIERAFETIVASELDPLLAASLAALGAATGLGIAFQLLGALNGSKASRRTPVIGAADALDLALGLLRGELAGALLSFGLGLVAAALWTRLLAVLAERAEAERHVRRSGRAPTAA